MASPRGKCGQHDAAMVMRTTFAQDSSAWLGLLGAVVGLLIGEGLHYNCRRGFHGFNSSSK